MVIFTSKLFDAEHSPLVLHEDPSSSTLRTTGRRLSRTATLDGCAVIDDAGYSDGDRTMTIDLQHPSSLEHAALQALIEASGTQRLSTRDGAFEGGIGRISEHGARLTIQFLVASKISE